MADEQARQEKIAAAKKRVEAMKKKNKKKADATKDTKEEPTDDATTGEAAAAPASEAEAIESEDKAVEDPKSDDASPSETPSLALQSKLRSTSFRAGTSGSPTLLSPEGETAPDIYRKQVARIEELEKENKRLVKDVDDSGKRWKKAEEELADLREVDGDDTKKGEGDVQKLKDEITSLQRQNTQLQQQVSKGGHGHRQSISAAPPPSNLMAELESKSSTIESMEIEISTLKARAERQESGASTEKEQVTALEDKVARAEAAAGKAQRELQDLKKNLDRTSEKAVREGSERSSAETKVKTLEDELKQEKNTQEELTKKVEALEKKIATLTTLHKEQDARSQSLRKEKEAAKKEIEQLKSENTKSKSRKSTDGGGGLDDEQVDELENEERLRLEKKIRSLESENHELRSGAWIERRREMQASSPGFQDVDLDSGPHSSHHRKPTQGGGGIGGFFTSGLNALAGGGDDEFLEDDDVDFDEDAFKKAHEEEAKDRIERIKEIKRGLAHWEGWRLDLVDMRRGGGEGIGEIFEV